MKLTARWISQYLKAKGAEEGNCRKAKGLRKYFLLFSFVGLLFPCLVSAQSSVLAVGSADPIITPKKSFSEIEINWSNNLPILFKVMNLAETVQQLEKHWENVYEGYWGINFSDEVMTADKIAGVLSEVEKQSQLKSALIYITSTKEQLELLLVTPNGKLIRKTLPEANQEALLKVVKEFRNTTANLAETRRSSYLPAAQQLYEWMIAPLESELESQGIDTLLLCLGKHLSAIPYGALHDGKQFLVEKYSFTRIPAFKLIDPVYQNIQNSRVLAMGASEFQELTPLPAVPVELSNITEQVGTGQSFLNQTFTLENLQSQRREQPFLIVHLATHAEFKPGQPSNSFIQFWDSKLTLDKMRGLGWNNPPVNLLVLSACKTAFGDDKAELSFGGLAVQSGVKSALASLWYVSDTGTLALMSEFYQHLQTAPIKAEALREAQIAMIQGKVRVENGNLQGSTWSLPLPAELKALETQNLSHPFYWGAFMMIGSPW
ncbi:CHAT domain-containing protein [Microcoleus sp. FACHB-672]|uniref:CHAT domain-containing protein n=1 Tax=Microcoleus sp. FACHB-672 TaxID=2692825 RepID=UPI001F558BF1|nr:CHAT domain-containing protein [Microcoleus sp. FACHB-672]